MSPTWLLSLADGRIQPTILRPSLCRSLYCREPTAVRARPLVGSQIPRTCLPVQRVLLPGIYMACILGSVGGLALLVSGALSVISAQIAWPTGSLVHAKGARGTLQVYSAAAEAVKVYEKEYNIGRRHKMKVSQLSTVFCGADCKCTVQSLHLLRVVWMVKWPNTADILVQELYNILG